MTDYFNRHFLISATLAISATISAKTHPSQSVIFSCRHCRHRPVTHPSCVWSSVTTTVITATPETARSRLQ
jgi:hypothetical protein